VILGSIILEVHVWTVNLNAMDVQVLLQLAKHAIQQLIITTIQTLVNFAPKELILLELIVRVVGTVV
jgi:hypothetical protein